MGEEFLQQTFDRRDAYLRQMGTVDELVLAPMVNPAFLGGAAWPSFRQSWRTIRNGSRTIIISDGLSDPFEDRDEENTGFGIEVMGETTDPSPEQLQHSWLFSVVYGVSQQAAAHGGFRELIDELELFSMEIKAPDELLPLANADGNIGLLLGLISAELPLLWDLPAGVVKVVTVKLLQPAELEYVAEQFETGRARLRDLFAKDGSRHLSSRIRNPVI